MWNVRAGGWPFTLKVMVPSDPGGIFPSNFGLNSDRHVQAKMDYCFGLCYNLHADEDNAVQWDLFADVFEEEVLEDAETDSAMSANAARINAFMSVILHHLESFEHGNTAERLLAAVLPDYFEHLAYPLVDSPLLVEMVECNRLHPAAARPPKKYDEKGKRIYPIGGRLWRKVVSLPPQ